MIRGVVNGNEARLRLRIRGSRGREQEIEAIIDTGYTGSLTLPRRVIAALGLRWQSLGRGILADGHELLFDVFEGNVVWDRRVRRIAISQAEVAPLIGMALLQGYELNMQIRSAGKVRIKPLGGRGS